VHLHESLELMPEADVKVGPLSRAGVERIIRAAIGRQPEARTSAAVYEKTQGHLQAVMSAAKLLELDGEKSALAELERMSPEETLLGGVSKALDRLDRRKRDLLRAMCVLPDDVAMPAAVVNAIYARSAIQGDDAIGRDDLSSLRSIGAVVPAFDRESWHVAKTWRAASSQAGTEVKRESTVLLGHAVIEGSMLSELREPVVQALISVLPVDTRTRTQPNLSELELLGRHVVRIVTSKADCTLALRCAAVDALYGDHDVELDLVRRAHDWAGTTLGPDHPFTFEMARELAQCSAYPRGQARALMQQAFSSANRQDADPRIMLPMALAHAIEIGDENPREALEILERSYDRFQHSVDLDPILHVQIRNSIGLFNSEKDRAKALAIWTEASEFAAAHGLGHTQEMLRLRANMANVLMQLGRYDEAREIGRKVYESQLALWGSGHHLVLWAAVDYLQYCLESGRWEEALRVLTADLHAYRKFVQRILLGVNQVVGKTDGALPLNQMSVEQLKRLAHLHKLGVDEYVSPQGRIPRPRSRQESINRMMVFIELFELGPRSERYLAVILDDFLDSLPSLKGVDWSLIRTRLPEYYVRLDGALGADRKSRKILRRIARALVAERGLLARLRLRRSIQRMGLPTTHL
jgi:tetratricopeptide (TPR) repeat protein